MAIESATPSGLEEDSAIVERIKAELLEFGIENCPQEIIDRLVLLEKNSPFNNDSRMICEGFRLVLASIEDSLNIRDRLTTKQRQEGELAAYIHDIGKSGGAETDFAGQAAVVKLYSQEGIKDSFNQTVYEIVHEFFSNEEQEMMLDLAKSGVTGEMTMRTFYDQHAYWTHDILEKFPEVFSIRTRVVAGSHHIDRGINPYGLEDKDIPTESLLIGALEEYVNILEEKILRAVDKYQAAIARQHSPGESVHEKGMSFIRGIFSEKYGNDQMMKLILKTIDELGQKDALFPTTKSKCLSLRNELGNKPTIAKAI